MLTRKAYGDLQSWKNAKQSAMTNHSLLVMGARQVGKTTLIREFAQDNYANTAEINFIENTHAKETIAAASDAKDLFLRISALTDTQLIPGKTLIFFDEIQFCGDILTWAKFLNEQTGFDYIFSGSLLGIDAFNVRSLPVGFLDTLELFPLDFEEFCLASGLTAELMAQARSCFEERKPLQDYLHEKLIDLFYKYLLIGGMPEAVWNYVNHNDLGTVRRIQESIFNSYESDITKYLLESDEINHFDARHIKSIYAAIPGQLSKENKRFVFTRLGKNLRFTHLQTAFDWLAKAGVALPVDRVSDPQFPLPLYSEPGAFKLYMNDTGLLTSRLMGTTTLDILNRKSSINFGAIFENAAAQELKAHGFELFYYNSKNIGEIDFVLQDSRGDVTLCEIKSGKDYRRHRALDKLLEVKNYSFKHAMVFCDGNIESATRVTYLPIYMIGYLSPLSYC